MKEFDGNLELVNLVALKMVEEWRHNLERCNDVREMARGY